MLVAIKTKGKGPRGEIIKYVSQDRVMQCPDVIAIGPCHHSVSAAKRITYLSGDVCVVRQRHTNIS